MNWRCGIMPFDMKNYFCKPSLLLEGCLKAKISRHFLEICSKSENRQTDHSVILPILFFKHAGVVSFMLRRQCWGWGCFRGRQSGVASFLRHFHLAWFRFSSSLKITAPVIWRAFASWGSCIWKRRCLMQNELKISWKDI